MAISPTELDQLSEAGAMRAIMSRFGWTRKHEGFLKHCLEWQGQAEPRPNFYFRWHLPRLVATIELLKSAPALPAEGSVLDLSCYPPYSLLLQEYALPEASWTRTAYAAGVEEFSVGGEKQSVTALASDLNTGELPFGARQFDVVMFTETIEHVLIHPQFVLSEINRILRPGGCVLISTPNVTSWKKIKGMTDGNWNYDSPTFGNSWGHRFEYSPYQLRSMFRATGFSKIGEVFRDVYFDDPRGLAQASQFWATIAGKTMTGEIKRAAKMVRQRGSGMFLLWRKDHDAEPVKEGELVTI